MPQIIPEVNPGTMTVTQNTQMPSKQIVTQLLQKKETNPPVSEANDQKESEEKKEPTEDEKRLRTLLAREKQLFSFRKKLEEDQKSLELQRKEHEEKLNTSKPWVEAAELSKQDKLQALAKLGITYDELTQQIINNGQVPPAQIAEKTAKDTVLQALEDFKKEQLKVQTESQTNQYNQALKQVENNFKYVVDRSDKYPLVKASENYQDMVKEYEAEFHRRGVFPPLEEILDKAEQEAVNGVKQLLEIPGIRERILGESPKPTQETITSRPQTLSHRTIASTPSPKPMSEQERRQRAIDAFYGRIT